MTAWDLTVTPSRGDSGALEDGTMKILRSRGPKKKKKGKSNVGVVLSSLPNATASVMPSLDLKPFCRSGSSSPKEHARARRASEKGKKEEGTG